MSVSQNFPEVRPSLNLNFARSKTLDPRVTFTRASTGTYVGADGLVKTAQADEARFTYDPATGESLGLLVEEQRTNLIIASNSPTSATGGTRTDNSQVAPDGTTTAGQLVSNSSTGYHSVTYYVSSLPSGNKFAWSIFVKLGTSNYTKVVLYDNAQTSGSGSSRFDLSTGTKESGTGKIVAYPNGWYRLTIYGQRNFTPTSCSLYVFFYNGSSVSFAGDGTSTFYYWGAQLEDNVEFETSHVPTSGSAVTRQADKPVLLGSAITPLGQSFVPSGLVSIGTENSTIASSGGGSVAFDGNGDYLSLSPSDDFTFGFGDFTIELWTYFNSLGAGLKDLVMAGLGGGKFGLYLDGANALSFVAQSVAAVALTSANIISTNVWNHIAITRVNGIIYTYINGSRVSATGFNNELFSDGVFIGANTGGSNPINGYISNLRVVKGTALYTSNFTPIAPLKAVNGTVLLCCNSPTSATFEATGKTLTANGNASPSTEAPVSLTMDAQASDTNTISNILYYPTPLSSATVASMRNAHVPIVRDDLVLHLDAGYSKSYPGTGATWLDLSGKGNNGSLVNGVGYSSANGGSLTFDGVDDYITVSNVQPNTNNFTISVWVYKFNNTSNDYIWDFGTNEGTLVAGTSIGGYGFRYYNSTLGSGSNMYTQGTIPDINKWYNVAIIRNNGTSSMYVNSSFITSSSGDTHDISSTTLTIGDHGGSGIYSHHGYISNFKIYNRALTPSEVAQNFNALRNRFGV